MAAKASTGMTGTPPSAVKPALPSYDSLTAAQKAQVDKIQGNPTEMARLVGAGGQLGLIAQRRNNAGVAPGASAGGTTTPLTPDQAQLKAEQDQKLKAGYEDSANTDVAAGQNAANSYDVQTSALNNADTMGPTGGQNWEYNPQTGQMESVTYLSAAEQKKLEQEQGVNQTAGTAAQSSLNQAASNYSQPFNYTGPQLADQGTAQDWANKNYQATLQSLNQPLLQQQAQDKASFDAQMAAQGLKPGDEGYDNAYKDLTTSQNQAQQQNANQAYQQSLGAMSTLSNTALANNQAAYGQQLGQYNMPMQQAQAFQGMMGTVNAPDTSKLNTTTTPFVNPATIGQGYYDSNGNWQSAQNVAQIQGSTATGVAGINQATALGVANTNAQSAATLQQNSGANNYYNQQAANAANNAGGPSMISQLAPSLGMAGGIFGSQAFGSLVS